MYVAGGDCFVRLKERSSGTTFLSLLRHSTGAPIFQCLGGFQSLLAAGELANEGFLEVLEFFFKLLED